MRSSMRISRVHWVNSLNKYSFWLGTSQALSSCQVGKCAWMVLRTRENS